MFRQVSKYHGQTKYYGKEVAVQNTQQISLDDYDFPSVAIFEERHQSGHKVFTYEKNKVILLHCVTKEELEQIIEEMPTILLTSYIKEEEKGETLKYRIILGQGHFSNVRLGYYVKNNGKKEYVAVRKLRSLASNEFDKENIVRRDKAFEATQKELLFHRHLSDLIEDKNGIVITKKVIQARNQRGEIQLYQIMPIYNFSSSANLAKIFQLFPVSNNERFMICIFIAHELLTVLARLHKNHVYHRDIKPENLLLDSEKTIALADFGCTAYKSNGSLNYVNPGCDQNYCPPQYFIHYLNKTENYDRELFNAHKDCWAAGLTICMLLSDKIAKFIADKFFSISNTEDADNIGTHKLVAEHKLRVKKLINLLRDENVPSVLVEVISDLLRPEIGQFKSASQILSERCLIEMEGYSSMKSVYTNLLMRQVKAMILCQDTLMKDRKVNEFEIILIINSIFRLLGSSYTHIDNAKKFFAECIEIVDSKNDDIDVIQLMDKLLPQFEINIDLIKSNKHLHALYNIFSGVKLHNNLCDQYYHLKNMLTGLSYFSLDNVFKFNRELRFESPEKPERKLSDNQQRHTLYFVKSTRKDNQSVDQSVDHKKMR